jgi:CRP-like cAMP-binding protein
MTPIEHAIRQLIAISDTELTEFLANAARRIIKPHEILNFPGKIVNEIYFINRGILRVVITDNSAAEHTIHFAPENQFVTDYSSFMLKTPSISTWQALRKQK